MNVRVCFELDASAPLNVDGARTVLAGWLEARHRGGAIQVGVCKRDGSAALFSQSSWLGLTGDEWCICECMSPRPVPGIRIDDDSDPYSPQCVDLAPISGHGDILLGDLEAQGYFPLAVINALALLIWTPRGRRRIRSLDELAAGFDPGRISRRPAAFDLDALNWFNRRCIAGLAVEALTGLFVPRWQEAFGVAHRAGGADLSPTDWQQLLTVAIRDETHYLAQAPELARPFFSDQFPMRADAVETLAQPYAPDVLRVFVGGLATLEPFAYDPIDRFVTALRYQFKNSHGIRSRDSMWVIRAALTGQLGGPCLIEACLLLGRARCIERAQAALKTDHCLPPASVI